MRACALCGREALYGWQYIMAGRPGAFICQDCWSERWAGEDVEDDEYE